ncbi:MAG TPA: nuclear transport factor 2 family protein [Pyrinomonadaceae bacterium]|nr:nuclear transport factor 2 family protein [Pyrinomonadaceae bacterium]
MKRLTALAALLLVAAAAGCTTTTDNTNTGAGNANNANATANANANAAATPAGPTQADLEAKERQVWEAIKAKKWDDLGGMLGDDFVIVSAGGAQSKAEMMTDVKKYDLTEYTLSDFKLIKVDADLAVLNYTSVEKSTYDGHASSGKPAFSSSAWANRGGKWVAVYHQESEKVEMPAPAAGANANTAANTNANSAANANAGSNANRGTAPAASPATIASATDAEKAVWEAIKAKNADAFASYLLPDAVEVEPEGVFDKAASIKGVMQFDASKHTLSDFKETKLDADATLVTYKGTGPEHGKTVTMYHSTIWTNRGGQYKAAFHQGTNAAGGGM